MYQIGVDIGGTNIKIGLVDDALEIVERRSIRFPHDGPQSVADKLAEAIREVLTAAQVPETARRWRSCIRARSPDAGRRCSSRSARDSAAASF